MGERILRSIRGATCAENTPESITENVAELCGMLFSKNKLSADDIVNIQFTLTPDLDEMNPAMALRKSDTGIDTSRIPLFTSQEAVIRGMPSKVVRVMVTAYMDASTPTSPAYINGAQVLRPDLASR